MRGVAPPGPRRSAGKFEQLSAVRSTCGTGARRRRVTNRRVVGVAQALSAWSENVTRKNVPPVPTPIDAGPPPRIANYKGYTVCDLTCQSGKGRWTARVAIMVSDPARPRSQCFLDFETFNSNEEARARAEAGAVAWIDRAVRSDRLGLPSAFAPM